MKNQDDKPTVDKVDGVSRYLVPTLKKRETGVISIRVAKETKEFYEAIGEAANGQGFKLNVEEMLLDILTTVAKDLANER